MEEQIRVRFAPSPTGHLHIGNARTAILNWIFAQKSGGTFVLRIEDTDVERSSLKSENSIFDDLKWLGLDWHEGPDVGGDEGPYRQSERLEIYKENLDLLKKKERAYPCFCSEAELEKKRKAAIARGENPDYDRKCLKLSQAERENLIQSGQKASWRFYVRPGEVSWCDLVKDELRFETENFGDFIIMRPDGTPTYNFAAAVDDGLMKISHVIRGDDHASNTPKQILLYESLDWTPPTFCHIPMILGPDRARLSKRHGATSIHEFKLKGYLPEALINFLSLLSWSSETGDEILSVDRLINEFDFERMNKSPAIFDLTKFNWMNAYYIRNMELDRLVDTTIPYLRETKIDTSDRARLKKIIELVRDKAESLTQIRELVEPFYEERVQLTDGKTIALSSKDSSQKVYWAFLRYLESYDTVEAKTFRSIMKQVQKETGVMGKDLWMPIRVALTGQLHGPDLAMVAEILGKDTCQKLVKNLLV
ncbi:glutamate--tRNA ligase [candidate division KSB1 bacterium]|nr:glutamate--tRNA ligase [candidate division KSB1 bacterium]NIR70256.1 glutamate--tRNA ligase [candidate division KSB1 bacterium]NIS26527.1 glutamate--tRNA ligase [candidate division KSB1 bacterium]NIT73289.1 glutamate--tRNA ligase [candidate division KSB1 bacterium]NIU23913.1 glutamate--tRNA ligase [candidate division KSB1 bacterium]